MLDSLPAQVPIAAIVLFRVNSEKEGIFLQNANALTEATRRLPGCNVFAFHKSVKAGGPSEGIEYLIYEDWQTRDLFRTQWDSQHLQRFQHAVGDLIVAPPDLRFYYGWREYRSDIPPNYNQYRTNHPNQQQNAGNGNNGSESSYASVLSLPYAMSLFGLQQAANIFNPDRAAQSFENLARATEGELSNPLRAMFQLGDAVQRAAYNMTFGAFGNRNNNTSGSLRNWSNMAADVMQGATAAVSQPFSQAAAGFGATPPQQQSYTGNGQSAPAQPFRQNAPSAQTQSQTHSASGWGAMPWPAPTAPDPPRATPARTQSSTPFAAPASMAEPNISPDYPYSPHYVNVLGSKMHYIEQGSGSPILLLHGNPSWSYIWRNIIPHLSPLGRCIAPDLIGFGRSDKPEIEYLWRDHVRYIEAFIEALDLRDVTLVLHDQGSGLGFHYAMYHQENINAIAFFEAIVRPYPWDEFSTPEFRDIFRRFRTGGVGGEGWQMIVEQNMFIEQLLPQAAGRQLTEKEMNYYREPFRTRESRIPMWRFPRQTPIGGEPRDVWEAVSEYSERLQRSEVPKLMLYATPGALLTQEHVTWCQQNINNLQSVFIGPGLHFLQESSPHRIGREIAAWYRKLPR